MTTPRPSTEIMQFIDDVKAWCDEHHAEFVSARRVLWQNQRSFQAEIQFANGRSFSALAPTPKEALEDLARLGPIIGGT